MKIPLVLLLVLGCFVSVAQGATFTVTNTNDAGPGSLRQALLDATQPGADDIVFNIPGPGIEYVIQPLSSLPNVPAETRVLGETQRLFGGDVNALGPEVVLDGSNAGINVSGLTLKASDCLVREISIRKFYLFGINLYDFEAVNNKVEGCYIGTNSDGSGAGGGNGWGGIYLYGGGNTIGGSTLESRNLISGNQLGIRGGARPGFRNVIEGNYIGVDRTGQVAVGNLEEGIIVSKNVTIKNNLISGNADAGIALEAATETIIQGNFIGTNYSGTAAIGNSVGVSLRGGFGSNSTHDNTIGGTTAAARNIISGNQYLGIIINDSGVSYTTIQGNYIGTDFSGMSSVANRYAGIYFIASHRNTIGGTEPGARNVISGNLGTGVTISTGASHNVVQGNYVGVASDGITPLGNLAQSYYGGHGIMMGGGIGGDGYGTDNLVGGTAPGAANVVASNGEAGVSVWGVRNSVIANSIHSNGTLGVDLAANGVTPNDRGDDDIGFANNYQNYPELHSVQFSSGAVTIVGALNSAPNTSYRVEFFATDKALRTGFSQGQFFLGFATVVTDGSGTAPLNVTFPVPSGPQLISATATDPAGNTSEFGSLPDPLANISTRLRVQTGDDVLIGGFIVTGHESKKILIRAIGPSLAGFNVPDPLADPTVELFQGTTLIATNDDWRESEAEILATGLPPSHDAESALVRTLAPGAYTAIVRGKNQSTGIGLVEGYDLDPVGTSTLANISTRGFVDTGDNVIIGGFILGGQSGRGSRVVVRAIGASLSDFGIANALQDPMLELRNQYGDLVTANDDWRGLQETDLEEAGLAPTNNAESAIILALPAGNYTAVVRGKNDGTGVALVEVYNLP